MCTCSPETRWFLQLEVYAETDFLKEAYMERNVFNGICKQAIYFM